MTISSGDQPGRIERPSTTHPTEPEQDRPLTPGEALGGLFLANADRGANHANDELVAALRERALAIQALADLPPAGERPARWWALSAADHEVHLLAEGKHPDGALAARCGHVLPAGTLQHDQPPPGRPCEPCRLLFLEDHTKPRPAAAE